MKKFILLFCLSFFILGCEKEEEDNCPSNCGTITDDEILTDCYSLSIQNECSNNIETYCFDYDVWMDNYVGGNLCVYNVDSW